MGHVKAWSTGWRLFDEPLTEHYLDIYEKHFGPIKDGIESLLENGLKWEYREPHFTE